MQKSLFSIFLILFVILAGSLSGAFGEMMSTVGVAQGDFFRYNYASHYSSSDPHATIPSDLAWINQTDYFMINITGVSGASVNFETNYRGLNGSSVTGVCSMNVGTGMASISGYGGPSSCKQLLLHGSRRGHDGQNVSFIVFESNHKRYIFHALFGGLTINQPLCNKRQQLLNRR